MNVARALARRIRMIFARGVVTRVDDSYKIQRLQVTLLDGEVMEIQRFQNYGFTSVPFAGAEPIGGAVSGVRSHLTAVAVDDGRYRKKNMKPGEVALYTDEGDEIYLQRGKIIGIKSGGKVHVEAPTIEAVASTKATVQAPAIELTGQATVKLQAPAIQFVGATTFSGAVTFASTVSGPNGGAVQGSLEMSGDVKGGGISLKTHKHTDPQGGATGGPI